MFSGPAGFCAMVLLPAWTAVVSRGRWRKLFCFVAAGFLVLAVAAWASGGFPFWLDQLAPMPLYLAMIALGIGWFRQRPDRALERRRSANPAAQPRPAGPKN
jgi:hypothetical protein